MMTVGFFWRAKWISPLCFDLCPHRVSRSFKRQRAHLQANGLHSICITGVRGQEAAKGKRRTDWELKRSGPSAQALQGRQDLWLRVFTLCSHSSPYAATSAGAKARPWLCAWSFPETREISPLPCLPVGIPRRGREIGSVLHLSPNMHPRTMGKPQQGRVTAWNSCTLEARGRSITSTRPAWLHREGGDKQFEVSLGCVTTCSRHNRKA